MYDTIPSYDELGDHYAIKCTFTPRQRLVDEYIVLRQFDHPHIVQALYAQDRVLYMELAGGGTLQTPKTPMAAQPLRTVLYQTAGAIAYMHDRGYVHGDLKQDNVFLTEDQQAKVGDLGLSSHVEAFAGIAEDQYHCYHLPPEYLLNPNPSQNAEPPAREALYAIDSWSFGVMIWNMLKRSNRGSVYGAGRTERASVEAYQLPMFPYYMDPVKCTQLDPSQCLFNIMRKCLSPNPLDRPTMTQIQEMLNS